MNLRLPCSRCSSQEGSPCFSFGSNMEMLSAAPTDRENEDKIRAGAGQDKQGWELRNVRHAILANSNKLNDIHTFDTLLELIFCVKHNFNQVSQKKVLWNVFDYYQVRRGEERRGEGGVPRLTRWFYQQTLTAPVSCHIITQWPA